jgi:citrate synthase
LIDPKRRAASPSSGTGDSISTVTSSAIYIRGYDLGEELIGKVTFTEAVLLSMLGRHPLQAEREVLDAVLVAIMEHGSTPSSLTARLIADGSPGSDEAAVAGGLLAVGSRFLGTVQEAALWLTEVASLCDSAASTLRQSDDARHSSVKALVSGRVRSGGYVPGFGHSVHKECDPRVVPLLKLVDDLALSGRYRAALAYTEEALREVVSSSPIVNAAGAAAALLLEAGFAPTQVRLFALLARCGGLIAHIIEEAESHSSRALWTGH